MKEFFVEIITSLKQLITMVIKEFKLIITNFK